MRESRDRGPEHWEGGCVWHRSWSGTGVQRRGEPARKAWEIAPPVSFATIDVRELARVAEVGEKRARPERDVWSAAAGVARASAVDGHAAALAVELAINVALPVAAGGQTMENSRRATRAAKCNVRAGPTECDLDAVLVEVVPSRGHEFLLRRGQRGQCP